MISPDLSTLVVFISASLALIFAPGPASMYILTSSVKGGYHGGFSATFGTCTGLLIHTVAAVLGLSAILRTSAVVYTAVKYAGAAYLLYLGVQTVITQEQFDLRIERTTVDMLENYKQGILINTLNPKVAVFFLAFLPQFATTGPRTELQLLLLGVLYTTLAFLYQSLLVGLSSKIRTMLEARPTITDQIRKVAGAAFVVFGLELAVSGHVSN